MASSITDLHKRGLSMVATDSEDGELIYDRQMYTIRDGQLCELEYPRGPIMYCRE